MCEPRPAAARRCTTLTSASSWRTWRRSRSSSRCARPSSALSRITWASAAPPGRQGIRRGVGMRRAGRGAVREHTAAAARDDCVLSRPSRPRAPAPDAAASTGAARVSAGRCPATPARPEVSSPGPSALAGCHRGPRTCGASWPVGETCPTGAARTRLAAPPAKDER
eukprot:5946469-Prymnesium_polylepis.1